MKIVHIEDIVRVGEFANSQTLKEIQIEITSAIAEIVWPPGEKGFYLNPTSKGKGRGEGNGVKPIKDACMTYLKSKGWVNEVICRPKGVAGTGPLDAIKQTHFGLFAVEWETGNISSSHRALNKICLGVLHNELCGGTLILPSIALYPFLTDRIGNYRELVPYLPLWKSLPYNNGVIYLVVVEQDGFIENAPRIPKGTDGRALL